jgi:hypothetical protein
MAFVALMAAPPAARPSVRAIAWLGVLSAGIVVVGYWSIGVWATRATDWTTLSRWLIDYGADPTYGRSFNVVGFVKAMWTAGDTLLRFTWEPVVLAMRLVCLALLATAFGLGVLAMPFARGRLRPAAVSAIAQLAVGVPLIWWWAPDHVGKWWLLMLPAFVLIQATGVEAIEQRLARAPATPSRRGLRPFDAPAVVLAVVCLAFTGGITMRAMHRTDRAFDDALAQWEQHTQPGDVTIESDVTAHLLFWTRRPNALFIYRTIQASPASDRFARLREIIDAAHREGRRVFYVPGMVAGFSDADLQLVGVTREDVTAFFDRYPREGPVFRYRPREAGPDREVFRIIP